jgi:hypothetical protein
VRQKAQQLTLIKQKADKLIVGYTFREACFGNQLVGLVVQVVRKVIARKQVQQRGLSKHGGGGNYSANS